MYEQEDFIRQMPNGWWTMCVGGITQKFEYESIHEAYRDYCAKAPLVDQEVVWSSGEDRVNSMPFSWFPVDKNLENLPPLRELLKSTGPPIFVLNPRYKPVNPMKCNYCGHDGPGVFIQIREYILHCASCQFFIGSKMREYHAEIKASHKARIERSLGTLLS